MIESRVEKHSVKRSDPMFGLLMDFCHRAKNLYNQANFIMRQAYMGSRTVPAYEALDKMLKANTVYPDYKSMPTAQSAQQVLRMLCSGWKAFRKASADFAKHPEKYLGRPRMPDYLDKSGHYVLCMTNQNCRLKPDGYIHFPKAFQGFRIKPLFTDRNDFRSFQQVRFLPRKDRIVIELVYNVEIPGTKPDNGRYVGIDIGVNNLAAVSNNIHEQAFAINGKPLKSMNKYFNKLAARYKSIAKKENDRYSTRRIRRLLEKRNNKMNDYLHKASRYIVDWCKDHDISKIIIGKNDGWKQEINHGRKFNQTFMQIPFARLINMISYKAEEYGISR